MKGIVLTLSRMKKEINGVEFTGKCVTVFDPEKCEILRFVLNRQGAPLPGYYFDGVSLLDVAEFDVRECCPIGPQTENIMVKNDNVKKSGSYEGSIKDVYEKLYSKQAQSPMFMNDGGYKIEDVSGYDHSLELILVSNLKVINDRNKPKAQFRYNGKLYKFFSVTDSDYTIDKGQEQEIGDAYLAVSIPSSPHTDGAYYKFIAAIYPV